VVRKLSGSSEEEVVCPFCGGKGKMKKEQYRLLIEALREGKI
jgi:hypothetical protein